jgi:Ca-activated chloride channel family protein
MTARGWPVPAACGLLAVLLSAAATQAIATQQPYRRRTDLVSVYTTVTDKFGRLEPDLRKEDFEVRDNGKVQPLTFFSNELQPITIVVMLDRSGSMEENFPLVTRATEQFIGKLLPEDRARIGSLSRDIVISPPKFTGDQDALLWVLRHGMQSVGPSPIWTAVDRSITALLPEDGRRVVLLFSDGYDAPRRGQIVTELKDVIRRSEIDEVMVYAIGLADFEARTVVTSRGRGSVTVSNGRGGLVKPDSGLRKLADQSGGGYFELTWQDDLGATFTRVADELHHQYALGFVPPKLDGEVHRLEVKVKRPGLTARARRSYVAEAR